MTFEVGDQVVAIYSRPDAIGHITDKGLTETGDWYYWVKINGEVGAMIWYLDKHLFLVTDIDRMVEL